MKFASKSWRATTVAGFAMILVLAGCTDVGKPDATVSPSPSPVELVPSVPITDSGKQDGALGEALHDSAGNINRYIVASGDSALAIIDRFDLDLLSQLIDDGGKRVHQETTILANELITLIPNSQLIGILRVVDGGPIKGATGPTTLSSTGTPVTYTVVKGDSADRIRARFDIWWDQLADTNGLRLPKSATLFVGEVLIFTGSDVAFKDGDQSR